jgi:hypothetical protein
MERGREREGGRLRRDKRVRKKGSEMGIDGRTVSILR